MLRRPGRGAGCARAAHEERGVMHEKRDQDFIVERKGRVLI